MCIPGKYLTKQAGFRQIKLVMNTTALFHLLSSKYVSIFAESLQAELQSFPATELFWIGHVFKRILKYDAPNSLSFDMYCKYAIVTEVNHTETRGTKCAIEMHYSTCNEYRYCLLLNGRTWCAIKKNLSWKHCFDNYERNFHDLSDRTLQGQDFEKAKTYWVNNIMKFSLASEWKHDAKCAAILVPNGTIEVRKCEEKYRSVCMNSAADYNDHVSNKTTRASKTSTNAASTRPSSDAVSSTSYSFYNSDIPTMTTTPGSKESVVLLASVFGSIVFIIVITSAVVLVWKCKRQREVKARETTGRSHLSIFYDSQHYALPTELAVSSSLNTGQYSVVTTTQIDRTNVVESRKNFSSEYDVTGNFQTRSTNARKNTENVYDHIGKLA